MGKDGAAISNQFVGFVSPFKLITEYRSLNTFPPDRVGSRDAHAGTPGFSGWVGLPSGVGGGTTTSGTG
jgi:hypothetical protein